MKNRLLVAAVVLGPLVLLLFFFCYPTLIKTRPAPASPPDQSAAIARALGNQNTNTVALIHSNFAAIPAIPLRSHSTASYAAQPAGPATPVEFTNLAPETVLQNMSRAVRQFGEKFGGNPVGTNPEITEQLTGHNPKHLSFISAEAGLRLNANGELIDPWGTPFFFHQLSGREMEIHSAGPDRVMWTADDLVIK
jgi:hypothetical protein